MNAVVLGGADCVWGDVNALEELTGREWADVYLAVNDVGCHWPRRLDLWCTLHPEKLHGPDPNSKTGGHWIERRRQNGHPGGYTTVANRAPKLVHEVQVHWGGGSSGLYAVAVAYEKGADRLVLCGVPMNEQEHFAESEEHDGPWVHADDHWRAWERKLAHGDNRSRFLQENVRSMSGRTRDVLGAPTEDWLH